MKKWPIIVIVVLILLIASLSVYYFFFTDKKEEGEDINKNNGTLSYVMISINPDVELAVDTDGIVQEVLPINEDADIITSDLDLVGLTIEQASDSVIDAAVETGFIDEYSDENEVIITVADEDETVRSDLEDTLKTRIENRLHLRNIYSIVANGGVEAIRTEAESYDITFGKMLLINKAVTVDPTLTKSDLVTMKVSDIQKTVADYIKERREAAGKTLGDLKQTWKKEKTQLKADYQTKVNQIKDNILKEAGINSSNMTEEQKQDAISNALQAKKDQINETVNKVKKKLQETIQNQDQTNIKDAIDNARNQAQNGNGKR